MPAALVRAEKATAIAAVYVTDGALCAMDLLAYRNRQKKELSYALSQ